MAIPTQSKARFEVQIWSGWFNVRAEGNYTHCVVRWMFPHDGSWDAARHFSQDFWLGIHDAKVNRILEEADLPIRWCEGTLFTLEEWEALPSDGMGGKSSGSLNKHQRVWKETMMRAHKQARSAR